MSTVSAKKPDDDEGTVVNPFGSTQLDRLRERVDYLHERVGSESALERQVESVLSRTLRQTSAGRPEEMATILAPAIMAALREEIRHSPDEFTNLLSPLARPIAKGVGANIFAKTFGAASDAAIWLISPWRWFRSRSAAEDIADEQIDLIVRDVLVIHRATGLLVTRESIRSGAYDDNRVIDADFIADATSSIVSFVRGAYSQSEIGMPAMLSFGGRNWILRAGQDSIVAASYDGAAPAGLSNRFETICQWLESSWGSELRQFAGPLPVDRERAMSRDIHSKIVRLVEPVAAPPMPSLWQRLTHWAVWLAVVAALGLIAFWQYGSYRAASVDQTAAAIVEGHPDLLGYPISVAFDSATDHVKLQGLMPNREVAEDVVQQLNRATGYPIVRMFGIVSADRIGSDGRPMTEVMAELGADVRGLTEDLISLEGLFSESESASADWRRLQAERLDRLAAQVSPALSADEGGIGGEIVAWSEQNVIDVDRKTWSLNPEQLSDLAKYAPQLDARQFVGLRVISRASESTVEEAVMARELVRDQLLRLGFSENSIVNRATTEPVSDIPLTEDKFGLRLDFIDLSAQ